MKRNETKRPESGIKWKQFEFTAPNTVAGVSGEQKWIPAVVTDKSNKISN